MSVPDALPNRSAGVGIALRAVWLLVLWMILIGTDLLDLIVGLPAVAAATWASLLVIPAHASPLGPLAGIVLLARLPGQSLLAGVDVARRALDPRLPLHPGVVHCPSRVPPGPARNAFCALMSLQPGALPVGSTAEGDLLVHCLDTRQPVAAQMAAEEAVFLRLLRGGAGHG